MQRENGSNPAITRRVSVNCIMLVYFASGACSLIDEVVWVRLLKLTFGNTVYATSIVVSVFMAGLALGALIMGRYCDRLTKHLRLYALLETLITISALSLPWALKIADAVYVWLYRSYHPAQAQLLIVQVIISALILLIPTVMMGSTLPLLGRFVTALERETGHLVGKLYALNTLGAAAGCFVAGFFLIRAFGIMGTLYIAAGLNLLVAFGGWFLSRFSSVTIEQKDIIPAIVSTEAVRGKKVDGRFYLLIIAFFASGLISIGYELLWMRSIVLLLGGFTYVFSAVLTIYLLGNVIGAGIGSRLAKRLKIPAAGFAVTLSFLGLCGIFYLQFLILWTSKVLPSVNRAAEAINRCIPVSSYMINPLMQSLILFMVPAIIMGIGFPIALQAWANHLHKVGQSTGSAYGANTIGAVTGGVVTGFVLIPLLGLQLSISILGLTGVWIAGILWLSFIRPCRDGRRWALLSAAVVLTIFTMKMPSGLFNTVVGTSPLIPPNYKLVLLEEGLTTTLSLHRDSSNGALHMYSSGQSIAGDSYIERGDQKMLGHLGVLLDSDAKKVLSVGFGSGETTACLAQHNLQSIDCVEIAPEVVDVALKFFRHINLGDNLDSKVNMIFMDAKNYIHLTDNRYDIIINDSIHPRDFAENASLYTKEYFQSARERLNKNGMIISWLPTYGMSTSIFNSIIGTLMDVFPHVTIWYLTPHPAPLVLIAGSEQQQYFSPKYIEKNFLNEDIRDSLSKLNIQNNMDVLSCYIGDETDLRKTITSFSINSDYFPFVEFATDSKLPEEQILCQFVLSVRNNSIYNHINWTGFNKNEKEAWLEDFRRLHEAYGYILQSEGATDLLEKLKYILTSLSILPDKLAFLAARDLVEDELSSAGLKMILSNKADQALALSDRILKIYPQSAIAWMLKSVAMEQKGQTQQALSDAQQAVAIAPDNPNVHFSLGIIWLRVKQFDKAITEYKEALRLTTKEPSSLNKAKILNALTSAYTAAGRFSEAIETSEKALDLALSCDNKELAESIKKQLTSLKSRPAVQKQH
jgi:spermidine synthase